jgi:hypothetical protein
MSQLIGEIQTRGSAHFTQYFGTFSPGLELSISQILWDIQRIRQKKK